jgi:cytochrome b561
MRRYSKLLIGIHWASALFVLAAWFTAEGGQQVRANPPLLHFTLGLAVLLLVIPRLLARWMGGTPPGEDSRGALMRLATKTGHIVLYVFLVGLPLSGWYAASRLGVSVSFLGLNLPSIAAPVLGYPGPIAELHETGGTLILVLAGLHALIALWHQFVLRDGTLGRMIPLRRRSRVTYLEPSGSGS